MSRVRITCKWPLQYRPQPSDVVQVNEVFADLRDVDAKFIDDAGVEHDICVLDFKIESPKDDGPITALIRVPCEFDIELLGVREHIQFEKEKAETNAVIPIEESEVES